MIIQVPVNNLRKAGGSIHSYDEREPDCTDPKLEIIHDGKFIGTALRNGHHLTYVPPRDILWGLITLKGYHKLPYVIYYFKYEPFDV
jgi:hypothetical protein